MAFLFTVEDGTGQAGANSYVSVAEADDYLAGRSAAEGWEAITDPDVKEKLLVSASRMIDASVRFIGLRATATQALQWPRTGALDVNSPDAANFPADAVPTVIKAATAEMALALTEGDRTGAEGQGIREIEIAGAVRVAFDSADRPGILPLLVLSILRDVGVADSGAGRPVKLTRA